MTQDKITKGNELNALIQVCKTIGRWIGNKDYEGVFSELQVLRTEMPEEVIEKIMQYIKDQMIIARMKAEKELEEL